MNWLTELDRGIFLAINGAHSDTWDSVMWWVSGKITWWPFYLLLLGYFAWRKGWQLVPMLVCIVAVVALTDQTSVHLFKNVFQRLRPSRDPSMEGLVHLVHGKRGGLYGFISSHAANAAGVALLLSLWIRKWWFTLLMGTWMVLISYSRVYLGVHYPGDVMAGMAWGALCGWLVYAGFKQLIRILPEHWWIGRSPKDVLHHQ